MSISTLFLTSIFSIASLSLIHGHIPAVRRSITSQIRQRLNLPELTPEELAQARQDHPWLFETEAES